MTASDREPRESSRLRSGLRRHGLTRRPSDVRDALGRGELRWTDGNAVDIYDCGRDAFPVMLEVIASARDFVHLETYTFRDDSIGNRFIDALAERAAAGVEVRLLYDSVGSHDLDRSALRPLVAAGASVSAFNPVTRLYPRWAPRRRDHRKLLVVDGTIGFVGGLNVGDEYDAPAVRTEEEAGWRDTHARVRGPAVRELGAVFLESWFRADGPELSWQNLLSIEPDKPGTTRCAVLPDGPVYRRRAMRDWLVGALDGARERARLTSPYFLPDAQVVEALERAAARGVRVELLLAGPRIDHALVRYGARSTAERLLRRGIVLHEYDAAMMHAKSAVFDGKVAVVGTSNLDRQSFQHNYEVNLVMAGEEMPAALERLFDKDLGSSHEITLEGLSRRGAVARLRDRLMAAILRIFV